MSKRVVHGDDLLYRFFTKLFEDDPDVAPQVAQRMLEAMAVWLPLDVYAKWPVLLPWVVRDPTCRGSKSRGIPDEWSAPDGDGYLHDDNSLIKSLPRALAVVGPPGSHLHGARMGTEFVAAHIWRVVSDPKLASRLPLLNSFVPNLVWLPSQVAKLSDREGSPLQATLQTMSRAIYRDSPVASHLRELVDQAWAQLPTPSTMIRVERSELNWFVATPRFFATRRLRLRTVCDALERLARGEPLTQKVIASRYTNGLPAVDPERRAALAEFLARFADTAG